MQLFPRGLFEDALPPIALRTQVYSLLPDRTVADLQLVRSALETFGVSPSPQPSASRALAKSLSLRPSVEPPAHQQALDQSRCRVNPRALFGTAGRCHIPQAFV